jgi:hypothetical protein
VECAWPIRIITGAIPTNGIPHRPSPHCDLIPTNKDLHAEDNGNPKKEKIVTIPGWPALRLLCERLPKHTTIPLILAISEYSEEVQKLMKPGSATINDGQMHYFILGSNDPQHDKLWRYALPSAVQISGDYKVMGKSHHMDVTESPIRE